MAESTLTGHLIPSDVPLVDGSVVCVGVFDGVHRGHRAVIERARAIAASTRGADAPESSRLPVVAVTFDPHPRAVLRPQAAPPALCDVPTRVRLLRDAGCDAVYVLEFTRAAAATSPQDFVEQLIVERLHARAIVVGEDFRFGARAVGDVSMLTSLGTRYAFTVHPIEAAGAGGTRWSSTAVRDLLTTGDVAGAADVLGRPFTISGTVVAGERRGRELGFPTANLDLDPALAIPGDGVYAGWVDVGGRRMAAAISVGTNPQFAGRKRTVEAYVIDEEGLDLYGVSVDVAFVARVRGQEVFPDIAGLIAQMNEDVATCRRMLLGA